MLCICEYKNNVIGICKLPFKQETTKEERISELQRIIAQNRIIEYYENNLIFTKS